MKKTVTAILLAALLVTSLCLPVFAADVPTTGGIYNVKKLGAVTVDYQVQNEGGTTVSPAAANIDGTDVADFYADAVKLKVTVSGLSDGNFYLLLAQNEDGVPTDGNLVYIDQDTAASGSVSFTVYPASIEGGKTYHVYLSGGAYTQTEILSFQGYAAYMLGDVDNSKSVGLNDAIMIMRYLVDLETLDSVQKLAADVDKSNSVGLNDAIVIMRYLVDLETF